MRHQSRLYLILAVMGVCYALLVAVAVIVVRVPDSSGSPIAVPTLFMLPSVQATSVPTVGAVASDVQAREQVAVALAPTNTQAPSPRQAAIPSPTMTPVQAAALLQSAKAVEPTDAPLWLAQSSQAFVPTTEPESGSVAHQVVVRFDSTASEAERTAYIQSLGGTVEQKIDQLDTVVVNLPDDTSADSIPQSDIVAASEPDYLLSALDDAPASSDPALSKQWALPAIGAPSAWLQLPADAPTVVVAVIDSGVCASHPDLADHLVAGWDFVDGDSTPQDELGHGCSVAGVIAADVNNSLGIAGVAPNARIMPLRVLNAQGVGHYSDVVAAIIYAADHGAQVINLSLGGANSSDTLEAAINYAVGKGLTVVAASGNTGTEGVLYPAAYSSVIAVGSVDPDLERSSFSTYGPEVDLMAPGRNILTTTLNGDYGYVSGTSFAAPHVAGVEALDRVLGVSLPSAGQLVYAGASAPSAAAETATASATEAVSATEQAAVTETATSSADAQYADLIRQAQENGHVRLIVGLNVGFQPEGELSSDDKVEAQRAAIALAQSDVVSALSAYDVSITAQYEVIPYMALQADEAALRYLINSPDVTSIQEDRPVPPIAVTNTSLIGADTAWSMSYTGAGQAVAVLDTGVETAHTYLGARVVAERCHSTSDSIYGVSSLCPNGATSQSGSGAASPAKCSSIEACSHGTHVSGIAAGENSSQSGVAPDASIIAVQIFSKFSSTSDCGGTAPCLMSYESDQISGLQDIYNLRGSYNIAAVNMSLGGGAYTSTCDSAEVSMKSMIDSLRAVGIATVIAAGNSGYSNAISAPGCISTAISVGATTLSDTIASWSNRASFLSLFAPGVSINSSVIGGGYAAWSGTSMATPHVAGALAVLRSYAPNATVSELLAALKATGASVSGSSTKRIQIDAALVYLGAQLITSITATPTPTLTPTPSDVVFADGFESSSLAAWPASSTDNGNLSVSPSAAIVGSYGMQALINDKNKIYVNDDTPNALKSYRARFYFDPNSVSMKSGDEFYLFYGYTGSSTQVVRLELQRSSSLYQLRSGIRDDSSTWKNSSWYTISDAPHAIEIYWLAATKSGAKNGALTLWIDGAQKSSITKIDNDTRKIDRVRIGAVDGLDSNTKGTIYFDAFISTKTVYIGLDSSARLTSLSADEPTASPTVLPTLAATSTETVVETPVPTLTETPLPTATTTDVLPTATDIPPTETPLPTVTDIPPTATPLPTATDVPPTETPQPTATDVPPTETPLPTATDVPPTNTPEPPPADVQHADATEDTGS